jgi:hypothetical protein
MRCGKHIMPETRVERFTSVAPPHPQFARRSCNQPLVFVYGLGFSLVAASPRWVLCGSVLMILWPL